MRFKKAYEKADKKEHYQLFALPNYNPDIFEEISGIDTREEYNEWLKAGGGDRMTNIKDYENTVTKRLYDLMANINPCESCKFRDGTTDKCGSCCFWYASEFVMGDESEAEKSTSSKGTLQAKA